jgi:hypothetical protein
MYLAEPVEGTGFKHQAAEAELLRVLCSSLRAYAGTTLSPARHEYQSTTKSKQKLCVE